MGQCPGRGSSRSPAGSTEGLRKTGGKTVLFVSPGGPCTPSSQAPQAPGRDEMIINFLSPHHHHPWREVCTAHPWPIPDPHVWPLSLQDTQPLPLLQGSLTKGTPCCAQTLHTLLHMWTRKVFLEAQSSAHRALPNTPFSTQGVKMGGGQRETHCPRQLRLPLPVSPWPGKGLGLGGGLGSSAGKGVLSRHLCFHLGTECPGADPAGPIPDRAVPASLTFISLALVGVSAGGRDAQDPADGVRRASGVRAHRGHLRHGARGHCAEGEGRSGPAGEGAEAEGGNRGTQPARGPE